jgi:paraquat-inducible protein A
MKNSFPKFPAILLYLASIAFFVYGMLSPIMSSTMFLLYKKDIYLIDSVGFFFDEGELFIGVLILIFTFILPILKYIYLGLKLLGVRFAPSRISEIIIDIINKWAMLDVFVVALIIINMKMNSAIIKSTLKMGATYFAISIILLMICSFWIKYSEDKTVPSK